MRLQYHFILVLLAGAVMTALGAAPNAKVRLEMWDGCLCRGPIHARTHEQLKEERPKTMLFGKDVTVTANDATLAAGIFLRPHLNDSKLKSRMDLFRNVVVYRRGSDGESYSVQFRSVIELKMRDFKDGDLIIYYKESY